MESRASASLAVPGPDARESTSALALSALLLATLLHLRQIAYLATPGNRYAAHWERADGVALAATLLASAALLLAGALLLARWRPLRRALGAYWLWIAGNSLLTLATFWDPDRDWLRAGWFAVCAACALVLWRGGERVHRGTLALGRALWLVPALTLAQVLWWAPWGSPLDPLAAPPESKVAGPPVYFVIFDGWSAQESLDRGRFRKFMPELRALAAQSVVFERAVSPSFDTAVSVPRLLFARGEGWWLTPGNAEAVWQRREARDSEPLETAQALGSPNLFQPFAERGYETVLTGYYLPYRRLLGSELRVARSEPHVPRGSSLAERLRVRALAGARYLQGPGAAKRLLAEHRLRYSLNWYALNQRVLSDTLEIAARWPRNTFAFIHFPMPHPPFVVAADGSFRGPYRGDRSSGTRADYRLHLRNVDRIVGLFVAALRASGRFDDALIVMTGDHGWKRHDRRVLHVPLLIKWPRQRASHAIGDVFPTLALPALLELASRGGVSESDALRFIAEHAQPVPPEDAPL
jgi:hypothetical protein